MKYKGKYAPKGTRNWGLFLRPISKGTKIWGAGFHPVSRAQSEAQNQYLVSLRGSEALGLHGRRRFYGRKVQRFGDFFDSGGESLLERYKDLGNL